MGLESKAIADSSYGNVKACHSSAIHKLKEQLNEKPQLLIKYRLEEG
jgi:hypothetical protein